MKFVNVKAKDGSPVCINLDHVRAFRKAPNEEDHVLIIWEDGGITEIAENFESFAALIPE